jgi:hypothetical protein
MDIENNMVPIPMISIDAKYIPNVPAKNESKNADSNLFRHTKCPIKIISTKAIDGIM